MNNKSHEKNISIHQLGSLDKILYELGLVALGIFIVAVLLYVTTGFSVLNIGWRCMFNRVTGYPCPGCGGTRSLRALYQGDILRSLYDYPPLLFGIIVYLIFMVRCFLYRRFGIKKSRDGAVVKYIYIFVALILIQWMVKMIAQFAFGYRWFG